MYGVTAFVRYLLSSDCVDRRRKDVLFRLRSLSIDEALTHGPSIVHGLSSPAALLYLPFRVS
jgi:hypothetical protein